VGEGEEEGGSLLPVPLEAVWCGRGGGGGAVVLCGSLWGGRGMRMRGENGVRMRSWACDRVLIL
jgi:hypothetical protein